MSHELRNTVWINPRDICANPENCRDHSAEQDEVVSSLIEKFGWLRPLLFNSRFDRLIDGHERLSLAIEQNWPKVPVWIIDVDEDQEAEIVLAMDESGKMGTWNHQKTAAMMARLKDTSASVTKLIANLANREGVTAYLDRISSPSTSVSPEFPSQTPPPADQVVDPPVDPGIAERAMESEPPSLSASRVRLVQLFVDKDQVELFNEWTDDLMEMWGVTSVTDAVMRTLSDAHLAYLRGGRRRRA